MKKLIQGILDFRTHVLPGRREAFARLASGQAPDVLLITCSDSRVAPNWFASTDPGDLFVIRNVGNLVPPCTAEQGGDVSVAAAIDFALTSLSVTHIVVCGHSGCGAIHALKEGLDRAPSDHLRQWLGTARASLSQPPLIQRPGAPLSEEDELSQRNVLQQVEHLETYPRVQERVRQGRLLLHAWWFNIPEAGVYAYDERNRSFALIDEKTAERLLAAGDADAAMVHPSPLP